MSIRVTDSYLSSILVGDLNRSLGYMLKQQRMAGSMRRVNSFADDPRSVSSIQRYNQLIATNTEYMDNVSRSRIIVDSTDTALQNISDVLASVRELAMRESSALATDQTMSIAVVEVDNFASRLLDVLNTTVEGNYIFAGQRTSQPAFVRSGETIMYNGDDAEMFSRVGPNSSMAVNIPGAVFQGTQSSTLGGRADMAPRIQTTTDLADINLGDGFDSGSILIEDGLGNAWSVDLSSCLTIGDVITTINTETGGVVTAGLKSDGSGLELVGVGPLNVQDEGDSTSATSLGFSTTSQGGILTGRDIRPAASSTTLLADIESLSGSLPLGSMEVEWQGSTYTIDFSTATTLGDLETIFEAAVPGMELDIRDTSLSLIGGSPETFKVINADATNTASLLGLAGTGTPVRLFGMLEDLKGYLEAGDQDSVRGVMVELATLEDTVYQLMMRNGGRQRDLDWADGILHQRDERLRSNLSLEYDADIAQVASDLSRAEASYQASLMITSQLFQYNLIQFLR
ncbi:MAG: hypothetical protein ABIK96_07555 [bacterium]